MMGPSHRLAGALAGALLAHQVGASWSVTAMTSLIATSTSNGPTSPDVDQTKPWRDVAHLAPGLLGHRNLTHWWGLPAAAWYATAQYLPSAAHWPAYALLAGWVSHLVGDAVFGRVPLLPWGWNVGLGLHTGGFIETGRARVFGRRESTVLPFGPTRLLLAVALVWTLAGCPTPATMLGWVGR
jgi:hypothetical protein